MPFTLNAAATEFEPGMTAHGTENGRYAELDELMEYAAATGHWGIDGGAIPPESDNIALLNEFQDAQLDEAPQATAEGDTFTQESDDDLHQSDAAFVSHLVGPTCVWNSTWKPCGWMNPDSGDWSTEASRLDELLEYAEEAGHWGIGGAATPSESANIALRNEFDAVSRCQRSRQHAISSRFLAMLG